jgi:hypothetical protein
MMDAVKWDVAPSGFIINHCSGVPSDCNQSLGNRLTVFLARVISSALKMEETRSSETPVYNKPTWRYILDSCRFRFIL